jgi:hypothetical protein
VLQAPPGKGKAAQQEDNSVWLVWKYEGDFTLSDVMAKRDFPYNLEPLLLGRWGAGGEGTRAGGAPSRAGRRGAGQAAQLLPILGLGCSAAPVCGLDGLGWWCRAA